MNDQPSRLGIVQIARASALAPLLVVLPLLAFVVLSSAFWPTPLPEGTRLALVGLGVLPVYLVLAVGYLVLSYVLRSLRLLRLRSLLIASAAASIAIGLLYARWAAELSDPLAEQLKSFTIGGGFHLFVFSGMSWLWWRLARSSSVAASERRGGEA